jgi:hypothetical protein
MSHPVYARVTAIDRFDDARRRARLNQWWESLTKKTRCLLPFGPIHKLFLHSSGIHQGIREIPLARIVGTLAQEPEFDRDFRPLHKNQRQRWSNVWVLHSGIGWPPIVVHEIGDLYFVEDGHHRTSVARDLGLNVIEADVTAYPVSIALAPDATLKDIVGRLKTRPEAATQEWNLFLAYT